MTAVLERRATATRWLTAVESAEVQGVHRDTLVGKWRREVQHAHKPNRRSRFDQWLQDERSSRAAAAGKSIEEQEQVCACWRNELPPHVRGGARRSRHP